MNKAPKLITYQGNLYFRYAGPFGDKSIGWINDTVDSLFAQGEIDASDDALVQHRAIYLRDRG